MASLTNLKCKYTTHPKISSIRIYPSTNPMPSIAMLPNNSSKGIKQFPSTHKHPPIISSAQRKNTTTNSKTIIIIITTTTRKSIPQNLPSTQKNYYPVTWTPKKDFLIPTPGGTISNKHLQLYQWNIIPNEGSHLGHPQPFSVPIRN